MATFLAATTRKTAEEPPRQRIVVAGADEMAGAGRSMRLERMKKKPAKSADVLAA